jgi:pyruvate kinase
MCLYWGVKPIYFNVPDTHQGELESAIRSIQIEGGFENGTVAVITAGLSVRTPGSTSVLEIREMHTL